MTSFNLSDWALKHRSLIWYFMIAFMVAGLFAYLQLGRQEDPDFTIKTMVVQAQWPGASAEEVTRQVTDRIEKKLEELESLDYTKSVTTAGQTTVFVYLRDNTKADDVRPTWVRVRNMIADIKPELPQGAIGPGFNDRFGDVFGNIYAFTSDGLGQRHMRDLVGGRSRESLDCPNVRKVDILGRAGRGHFTSSFLDAARLLRLASTLGQWHVLSPQAQNAVTASGLFQEGPERISVRVSGEFTSEASLKAINQSSRSMIIGSSPTDVAKVAWGWCRPAHDADTLQRTTRHRARHRHENESANLLKFGDAQAGGRQFQRSLPICRSGSVSIWSLINPSSSSTRCPALPKHCSRRSSLFSPLASSVSACVPALWLRSPSHWFSQSQLRGDGGLRHFRCQRISLGALIIALGLLVDDAMIAVEMMVARLEVGDPLSKAATYVYTSTAFPMLTGTLVTVAGFIPIGLNSSSAGEYTFTLFVVIAVSLIVSWIVAVLFTPLLGVTILPDKLKGHHGGRGRIAGMFARVLAVCMHHRWVTIGVTVAAFVAALCGMQLVQQQFFPSSDRAELVIDWNLPQNASIADTDAQMARFERDQLEGNDRVEHWSTYVGTGAPRFVLSFDLQTANSWFGQDGRRRQRAASRSVTGLM